MVDGPRQGAQRKARKPTGLVEPEGWGDQRKPRTEVLRNRPGGAYLKRSARPEGDAIKTGTDGFSRIFAS